MLKAKKLKAGSSIEKVIGGFFYRLPFTPNQWTLLSVILGAAGFVNSAVYRNLAQSLMLFFVAFAADYIDGSVARYTGRTTKTGAYIDGVADRFVEAFVIISLMFYEIPSIFIDSKIALAGLLFFSTMTSYARAYADHRKIVTGENELRKMGGLLERFERVSVLLISVTISFYYGTAVISYAVILLVFLSAITVIQRILYAIKEANQ